MTIDCLLADYWLTTDMTFGCICDFFEIGARDVSTSKNVILWVQIIKTLFNWASCFWKV